MGMSPLNATTSVTIIILDQNDNDPVIQNITVFNNNFALLMDNISVVIIPENHPTYTTVSMISYYILAATLSV